MIEQRFLSTVGLVSVIMKNGKIVQHGEIHAPASSEDAN